MTGIRRNPRARGTVDGLTRALAAAALLTFGATCAFAAESGTAAKDPAAKPAATAPAASEKAPAKEAAATTVKATEAEPATARTQGPMPEPAKAASAKPATAKTQGPMPEPAKAASAKPATTKAEGAKATTAKAEAARPAAPRVKRAAKPSAKAASAVPVRRKAAASVASGTPAKVKSAQPKEDRVTYHYNALGRRDPFKPLVDGFIGANEGGTAPPDVGGLKVVGIVWGANDKFALVEDPRGNSMVLRRGDKVMNGVVEGLKRESLIVKITVDGQSQSVEIPLTRKGDDHDNQ